MPFLFAIVVVAQAVLDLATLDPRWIMPLETPAAAGAAFDARTAYVPLRGGVIVAVDLDQGAVVWRRELTTTIPPATGDGLVFVATEAGVTALASLSGDTRWQTPIPGHLTMVAWDTGWVLCANQEGDLAALRASDGSLVWRTNLGATLTAPPAGALDYLYLALEGGRVRALELVSGRQLWERTLSGRITGLAPTADQLVISSNGREVVSLDPATGRSRWSWRVGGDVAGLATSDEGRIYFASRDNILRAVDRRSGNLRWYAELATRPTSGPILFQNTVLVPLATTLAVFEPTTGKSIGVVTASGEISSAPHLRLEGRPTAARLIAMTRDGRLQGFGVRHEPALAPLQSLPGQAVAQ